MKAMTKLICILILTFLANSCKNSNDNPTPTSNEKPYFAGGMETKEQFRYGRFVVRMKPMRKSGVVVGFFTFHMRPDDWASWFRTNCEEIDLELVNPNNDKKKFETNYHYGEWNIKENVDSVDLRDFSNLNFNTDEGFHKYSFEWTKTYIAWFVDDTEVSRATKSEIENNLTAAQNFSLNIWPSNNHAWCGELNDNELPINVEFDWAEHYPWTESGGFSSTPDFHDDFNNDDEWNKYNFTFPDCNADFEPQNVEFKNGFVTLWLKKRDTTIPTTTNFTDNFEDGDFTNNPHWDFFPGGEGCHVTGTADIVSGQFHVLKTNAPGCGTGTQIEHSFNLEVTDNTKISFDINPVFSDVGDGAGWTDEEYPAFVNLRLWDANNDSTDIRFCYNYRGGVSHTNGTIIFVVFPDVPQNVWQMNQMFKLHDYAPDAIRISKIYIGGNGWDYEGYVDNINISSQ